MRVFAMAAAAFSIMLFAALTAAGWRKYFKKASFAAANGIYKKACVFLPAGYLFSNLIKRSGPTSYERSMEYKYRLLGYNDSSSEMLAAHMSLKFALAAGAAAFTGIIGGITEPDAYFAVFALLLPLVLSYAQDRRLDTIINRRKRRIGLEFPVFLNKLVLLTGAGMNFLPAITKIAAAGTTGSYLHDELKKTLYDIETGKSYQESFEGFSRRCGILDINTFVSLLLQNMRKGNDSLVPILRLLSDTCWEKRRNMARKIGEEMSTKLILPTMMIFIAALILLMTPAFIQMSFV